MLSKHAGWGEFFEGAGRVAKNPYVVAAAAPIIGMGMDAGIGAVRKMMLARGKTRAYKGMIAENPQLKKKPPRETLKFFNTLYNANPNMAKDPLVASSWVHTQMEQQIPGVPHAGVVEGVSAITKIRQQMRDPSAGRTPGTFAQIGTALGKSIPEAYDSKHERHGRRIEEQKADLLKGKKIYDADVTKREANLRTQHRVAGAALKQRLSFVRDQEEKAQQLFQR